MKQEIARGERSGTELVCVRQTCDSVGSTTRGAREEEGEGEEGGEAEGCRPGRGPAGRPRGHRLRLLRRVNRPLRGVHVLARAPRWAALDHRSASSCGTAATLQEKRMGEHAANSEETRTVDGRTCVNEFLRNAKE